MKWVMPSSAQWIAFLDSLDVLPPRPLVLAAGSGAYLYVIGDVLRRYLDRKLGLRLMTADSDATLAAVRDGSADVGVTALTIPPEDLDCELLTQYPQVLAVRPDHRLGIAPAVVNGFVRTPAAVRTIPIKDLPPIRYYLVTRRNRPADARLDTLRTLLTRFVS